MYDGWEEPRRNDIVGTDKVVILGKEGIRVQVAGAVSGFRDDLRLGALPRLPLPDGLGNLVDRALSRNPGDRPASAAEFVRALMEVLGQQAGSD